MLDMSEDWIRAVFTRQDVQEELVANGGLLIEEIPCVRAALRKAGWGLRMSCTVTEIGHYMGQPTAGAREFVGFYKLKGRKTI
jgi:hypothetical protein